MNCKPVEILLVEDSQGDVELVNEAFIGSKMKTNINVVNDGVTAMEYLRKEGAYANTIKPDIILLDLNLPRKDGRQVLEEIKNDPQLKLIPVVVLTTSEAEDDILKAYENHANCYIKKPVDFIKFSEVVKKIEDFWFTIVKLPK